MRRLNYVVRVFQGNISPYFVQKYGFPDNCKITPFTGDNLQSLIGLAVKKDELIVSFVLSCHNRNVILTLKICQDQLVHKSK